MSSTSQLRLAVTWLFLSAITLLAWWIGTHHPSGVIRPDPAVAVGAIAITVVKVRVIIFEFMDARAAPAFLRRGTDAWLACFSGAMLFAYFFAGE